MTDRCTTRLATSADGPAIGALRLDGYRKTSDFSIVNHCFFEKLSWSREDDEGYVVAAFSDDEPVATMRLDIIRGVDELGEFASGMIAPPSHMEWPAVGSCRTAIRPAHRKAGLVMLIRYHFVRAAMQSGARRLYSYVISRPPGTSLTESMGYESVPRPDRDPDLATDRPWELRWLDLEATGAQALALLDELTEPSRRQYPWIGPELVLPKLR